jgi:NitT/TauT family transport system substrate-binding protein
MLPPKWGEFMTRLATKLIGLLGLLAAGSATAQTSKLAIGYSGASEFLPAFVAKDSGIFEKHGIDATLTNIPISSTIPAALMSGNLDIGISSPTAILIADEGGLDLVGICASNRLAADNPRVALVTRPGFEMAHPADLKGRKIGIPGFYSSLEVMFRKWASDKGVPPAEMTLLEVPLPQMADVLRGGGVDAVATIEPVVSRILGTLPGSAKFDYVSPLSPDALGAFWMTTRGWAEGHRDLIGRYIAAYEDAIAEIRRYPDAAHRIEAKYVGYVGRSFPSFSTRLTPADFEFYQDMMVQLNLLHDRQDVTKLVFK